MSYLPVRPLGPDEQVVSVTAQLPDGVELLVTVRGKEREGQREGERWREIERDVERLRETVGSRRELQASTLPLGDPQKEQTLGCSPLAQVHCCPLQKTPLSWLSLCLGYR